MTNPNPFRYFRTSREIIRLGLAESGVVDFRLPPPVETRPLFARFGNMLPMGLWLLLALGVILLDRRLAQRHP